MWTCLSSLWGGILSRGSLDIIPHYLPFYAVQSVSKLSSPNVINHNIISFYLHSVNAFTSYCAPSFNFIYLLLIDSMLLIPFSLISVITFYIHEFRGLPFFPFFFFFQADNIPTFFEVAFLLTFFTRDHNI